MARPVVTGIGRRLPMPRSFATFQKGAYDVKISGNAPERIELTYWPEFAEDGRVPVTTYVPVKGNG